MIYGYSSRSSEPRCSGPALTECWASVADAGPTFSQSRVRYIWWGWLWGRPVEVASLINPRPRLDPFLLRPWLWHSRVEVFSRSQATILKHLRKLRLIQKLDTVCLDIFAKCYILIIFLKTCEKHPGYLVGVQMLPFENTINSRKCWNCPFIKLI